MESQVRNPCGIISLLIVLTGLSCLPVQAQQPPGKGGTPKGVPAYYVLPDSVVSSKSRIYDFALLPYGIPCIAVDGGLYMQGINEWLLPARSMALRSVLYDAVDSNLLLISPHGKKTLLCRFSINTGRLSVLDSLDESIYRLYAFSDKYIVLSGKEGNQYKLWLYNKKAGYMSDLYHSDLPVTAVALYNGDELLVASGGVVVELGHDQKVKQVIPVGLDIDGLLVGPGNEIIISTIKGIMSIDQQKKAQLLIDKQHGLLRQYNGILYVLDADNHQVIKRAFQ
jgi:hypothetical protein